MIRTFSRLVSRRTIGGTLLALSLGLALVSLNAIEVPHPWIYGPEASASKVYKVPHNRRWMVAHGYGALSAQTLDIDEFQIRANGLSGGLSWAYYDGAAHHFSFDQNDIEGTVSDIQRHIPEAYRELFYDGMVRSHTLNHASEPDAVIAWAERVTELTSSETLVNGIRIGIQQALGDDMPTALKVASTYPTEMHPQLFEELGWRTGDGRAISVEVFNQHRQAIPMGGQCSFAEGMIRGRILRLMGDEISWWPRVKGFHTTVNATCEPELTSGIAEALLIAVGDQPVALSHETQQLPSGTIRESVTQLMQVRLQANRGDKRPTRPPSAQ